MAPDDNIQDKQELISSVIETAKEYALNREKINLTLCHSREKNRIFMARYRLHNEDVINMILNLRMEEYCFTSRETGEKDAYVFGPETWEFQVFLKFQIDDGILVISLHEPDRPLDFPFRRRKQK